MRTRPRFTNLGLVYLAVLTIALVVPADANWHATRVNTWLGWHEDIPARSMVRDLVLNVAIFVPVGLWLARELRGAGTPVQWQFFVAVLLAGGLSLTMETLQYLLAWRASGILDVLANTVGAAIGATVARRRAVLGVRTQRAATGRSRSAPNGARAAAR